MKTLLNTQKLPRLTLVLGVAGFTLRRMLYAVAVDHKNLLTFHPLSILLGAVTVAAIVMILVGVLGWNRERIWPLWPGSWGLVTLLGGLGFGSVLFEGGFADSRLILVRNILALVAAAAMAVLVLLDKQGKKPSFWLYSTMSLFFAVHMVSCYQGWSSNPQIQDYLFSLLGGVGLMLYTYHKAAAAVGFRKEKQMLATGLLTTFFCFVALSGTGYPILLLTGGYWVLVDVCKEFSGE